MLITLLLAVLLQAPTVLDGTYSDTQAARGKALYTANCGTCHGDTLEGVSAPALTGNRFLERWRESTLDGIYGFIRERMPLGRSPNSTRIADGEYLDILTYVLKLNGYPAGPADLTMDRVGKVILVGKTGPLPVPDGSLVITVGCLSQRDDTWILSNAAEPARTRTEGAPTTAEVKSAGEKPLGTLTFRLADLDAVPDFAPETHQDHKMLVKGYLVRQPNAERIHLSSIEMISAACRR
ncbi:MAG TPA: cytochrome c [Terriglobia bacterium]|jgi:mono/diheme cytochrome c family protein